MRASLVVTRQLPRLPRGVATRKPGIPRSGTAEGQRARTVLHQFIAEIIAGQHLSIGPRADEVVYPGISARVVSSLVGELRQRLGVQYVSVRKRLGQGPRVIQIRRVGKVLASRNGHGAEPFFVGGTAVIAVADERVALYVGGLAGNLGEGLLEVGIDVRGVAVVEVR